MSISAKIAADIRETQQAIRIAEAALAADSGSYASHLNLASFKKRKAVLQEEFTMATRREFVEVLDYRLRPEADLPAKAISIAKAILDFQELVSVVYDAVKNGAKAIAKIEASTLAASQFDFGYCYEGSVGIVMTLPNEPWLIGPNDLNTAMGTIFDMAASKTPDQLKAYAKQLGVPSLRRLFTWADNLSVAGLGADIVWKRGDKNLLEFAATALDMANLGAAIKQTSEEAQQTINCSGMLLGLDVATRRFHMRLDSGVDINGQMSPKIGTQLTIIFGTHYSASVLEKKVVEFATGEEKVSYDILTLKPTAGVPEVSRET